jgi:hypothetical protein
MEEVVIYRGGSRCTHDSIRTWGLTPDRTYYFAYDITIAQNAASCYSTEGDILEVRIPKQVFKEAIEQGLIREEPYCGVLTNGCSSSYQVIVPPEGIQFMNRFVQRNSVY